ncbi:hypothetical protein BH09VER1_BH09VER1_48520 [soil metagenome]
MKPVANSPSLPSLRAAVIRALLAGAGLGLCTLSAVRAQDIYDLRSAGPGGVSWVAAVQDQSNLGDCWTFGTTTALDSNLIMNGYLPTSTVAPAMALSSWHLSAYNGAKENTLSDSENYNGIVGGDNWMTTSYYTRGQGAWPIPQAGTGPSDINTMGGGPILNSSNALNPFPLAAVEAGQNLAASLPPVSQTPGFTVTGAYYFDQPGTSRSDNAQVAAVKGALQQYGALATYMYAGGYTKNGHDDSVFHYDEALGYEYAYNPTNPVNVPSDHVVTIIGWDDNVVIPTATGTTVGGWIVQNSWGAWGGTLQRDDGTFYAPYTDPFIGKQGVTAFTAVPAGKYSPTVMQNELGPTYATGNWGTDGTRNPTGDIPTGMGIIDSSRSTMALSKLTSTGDGTLLALGLTSLDAQVGDSKLVTVTIYDGINIINGVATPGTELETQTFTFIQEGYTLFDLSTPISLTDGQMLAIMVNYNGSAIPYVWQAAALDGVNAPTDLTYFYDQGTSLWQDFGTFTGTSGVNDSYDGIFSVKGVLAVPEPATCALLIAALGGVLVARRRRQSAARAEVLC